MSTYRAPGHTPQEKNAQNSQIGGEKVNWSRHHQNEWLTPRSSRILIAMILDGMMAARYDGGLPLRPKGGAAVLTAPAALRFGWGISAPVNQTLRGL